MLPLFLSFALAAAPIPKGDNYEGCIALILLNPMPTALVFSPSGEELKRIPLSDIKGTPNTIRIGRDRTCLLVDTVMDMPDEKNPSQYSLYWIDLTEKSKPKKILTKNNSFSFVLNRESTMIYGSEYEVSLTPKSKAVNPNTHWQYDVKTGKVGKVDLPENYSIIDICHADNSILVGKGPLKKESQNSKFAILSSKDWKPTYESSGDKVPRLISPDGKSVVYQEVKSKAKGFNQVNALVICNIKKNDCIDFPKPNEVESFWSFTIGTNNRVVGVHEVTSIDPTATKYEVYVISYDGTQKKKIYTSQKGEQIQDCDWR